MLTFVDFKTKTIVFEQTFKNIDDILHKMQAAAVNWIINHKPVGFYFLKYLDDLEKDRATAAQLSGKPYANIIDKKYQWTVWAAPKTKDGNWTTTRPWREMTSPIL